MSTSQVGCEEQAKSSTTGRAPQGRGLGFMVPEGVQGVCPEVAGAGSPSLDSTVSNRTTERGKPWDRQQRRAFQRLMSCVTKWEAEGFQLLRVDLTGAPGADQAAMARHHQALRQRVERHLGFKGLEFVSVRTMEGNGVLHLIWAWRPFPGERWRSFYVGQRWLSRTWQDLHGAPIVWVQRLKPSRGGGRGAVKYIVCQHLSQGQGSDIARVSWSWGRTFGFALVKVWSWWKRRWSWGDRGACRAAWVGLLRGGLVRLPAGWSVSLASIRAGYPAWAAGGFG